MPKPMTKTDATDTPELTPISPPKTDTRMSGAAANVVKKDKPRYVRVENKLRQVLSLSVVGDDGNAVEVRLEPLATSAPLREDRLTDVIRRFHADGKVRIR